MGDQPEAIRQLVEGIRSGQRAQVLQGVTGSGKTFTVANVIAQLGRPTLVLSHNKTLAAQLYGEFKQFFPDNAVEYFTPTTTTTNPKPTYPPPTPTSKKTLPSTTISTNSVSAPPRHSSAGVAT